jgi:hypothetical protein
MALQPHLTFANVLCDYLVDGPWHERLIEKLVAAGLRVEGDELWRGDGMIGFFELAELDEVAGEPWAGPLLGRSDRPWVGKPAGVFAWTHAAGMTDALDTLIPTLMRFGRGPTVRRARPRDPVIESVVRRTFPLGNLWRRHGFEDGAALLREEPAYLSEACDVAEAALKAAGYEAAVTVWDTHHNPLQISGAVTRHGVQLANSDIERELDKHSFEIWAYNTLALHKDALWED